MKIDRLLSILLLLLKKEKITAPELAAYFETSLRTIYRDMDTLNQAGIPICSEQGSGGGYSLMPGFTLDRQVLKVDELLALASGLRGLQDISEDSSVRRTYEKVRAVAPQQKERLEINFFGWDEGNRLKKKVRSIHTALGENLLVRFTYTNLQNQRLCRETEPHKLFFLGSNWYLLAWCRVKDAFRFFRITRMDNLEILATHFVPREYGPEEWSIGFRMNRQNEKDIHLRILADGAFKAKEYFSPHVIEEKEDGSLEIKVKFPPDEWLYSYLLGYGEWIQVLHPPEVRQELKRRAEILIKNNRT